MARGTLHDTASERPDVVLVSDGGGVGPEALDIARQISADGIRISAVFVAPDDPPYGLPPVRRDALVALTEVADGVTVDATDTARLEGRLTERRGLSGLDAARRTLLFADHGRWLIALSLVPLAALFRRRQIG